MNVIAKGIFGAALMATAGLAQAEAPIYYTVNDDPTIYQLDQDPITDTFVGSSTVRSGFCNVPCTLSATGTLTDDTSTGLVTLSVTDADTTGSILCNSVVLSGFPWVGSVEHDDVPSPLAPVTFSLSGVSVVSLCGTCSNTIDVTFDPADGGSFVFNGPITPNGSCNVNGVLTSKDDENYYTAWH